MEKNNRNMYISRDFTKRPVTDFIKNVKPILNDNLIAEEVYNDMGYCVGWNIKTLVNK
jgi:hypothetical protein